jgi:hypothetical protein
MVALRHPAIGVLESTIDPEERCEHCGRGMLVDPALAVKTAQIVLDRTGFGPSMTIKPEDENAFDHVELVDAMTEEEFATVDEIMTRVVERVRTRQERLEAIQAGSMPDGSVALSSGVTSAEYDSAPEPAPSSLPDPADEDVEEF